MTQGVKILATIALLVFAGAAYMRLAPSSMTNIQDNGSLSALMTGDMARLDLPEAPYRIEDFILSREDGSPVRLSDMHGKIILVNIWASYCAPCQYEMKDLNDLQLALGDESFEVVAINVDRGGVRVARRTLNEWEVPDLTLYADPTMNTAFKLAGGKMPTSLIVDKQGMVRAKFTGPLNWASEDAIKLFKALKAEK